ncbi:class I SAM-dependent methyltransferase [Methylophaga sp.]|uniref:class I SAM-dependent methyltransferase n=1 Tax=Methylophaga sp. TaxID=2024840 RepID=UPI003F69F103
MTDKKHIQINEWWQSPLGQLVSASEQEQIAGLSSPILGLFTVQIGGGTRLKPLSSRSVNQSWVGLEKDFDARPDALPFKSHSIDNLLLLHVLEYADEPHQVLRETERVLAADGKLILCCFNPISFWGLRRLFSWQDAAPWHGYFFTKTRVKDWLALLNFEVTEQHKVLFRPPFKRAKWLEGSCFLERWGRRLWPWFGGVSVMVATKRTIPLNPLRENQREHRFFPSPGLINRPITRDNKHGSC